MKKEKVPIGRKFLPGTSITTLRKEYKNTKDKKSCQRYLACIKRKQGMEMPEIAAELEVPYPTVYRWLAKIARSGLDAVPDRPKPGRRPGLTAYQYRKLYRIMAKGPVAYGFKGGVWTARRAGTVIEKEFGVVYTDRAVQKILHRIGLSSRTPRPRHPKAATPAAMAAFKRKVAGIRGFMGEGTAVCMMDSAALIAGWNMQRGWYPVGESVYAPVTLSSTRAHMLGALYDGHLDLVFPDKVDQHAIVDFLHRQMRRHDKLIVILDNASWHHAGSVKALEDEVYAGRLYLVHLPPYTPELNSIELMWRMIRKAISNTTHDDIDKLTGAVRDVLLDRDVLLTSIARYARDKKAEPPAYCTVTVENKTVRNRYYL